MLFAVWLAVLFDPTLPSEIAGQPGAFIAIKPKTAGKVVKFVALDSGINLFPSDLLADKTATVASSVTPGRYRILAYTALDGAPSEPAIVTVVIGGVAPPDVPPDPEDPLAKAIESLWGALQEPDRETNKSKLVTVYRRAAQIAMNNEIGTVGGLYSAMRDESNKLIPATVLKSIREKAGEAVCEVAPTAPATKLTSELRAKIAEIYNRLAKIVEGLK